MGDAPRTMTVLGLGFLKALAARKTKGTFLEVGPLFGSSTNAINDGRKDTATKIHTIDTFEAAPWVQKRFGFNLSRELFNKFTSDIPNLVVHQGFAPDIVINDWKDDIGFYFDDATHGNPGWNDNYDFFSMFFNDETLICGDDFASGWPDIVRNVYKIAEASNSTLYIMGRVWAMAHKNDKRIIDAVNEVCPRLKDVSVTTKHAGTGADNTNIAACWSQGLHRTTPLDAIAINSRRKLKGQIVTFSGGCLAQAVNHGEGVVSLKKVNQVYFSFEEKITVQYCLLNANGKTHNTKAYKPRQLFDIPAGERIVAIRLSDA